MGAAPIGYAEEPATDVPKPQVIKPKVKVQKGEGKELLKVEGAEGAADHAEHNPMKKKAAAKISADAKAELAKITQAYKALAGLELAGTVSADIKVGGQEQKERAEFSASFAAPNQFRHEVKDDLILGSTGQSMYAFRPTKNDYKTAEAPKARGSADQLPSPIKELLQMQNPGLLCAVVDDAGKFLADDVLEINKSADLTIDGKSYPVLDFKGEKESYSIAMDPKTHLVRRLTLDMKKQIEAAGRSDVEKFTITFDYAKVSAGEKAKPQAFAWVAPDGSKDQGAAEAEETDALALVGKAAPDFTLNGLDGKPVSLKEQRGQVVILDFWATWCGPCRVSLPGLDKLHQELAPKGLKTFAVDLEESKDKVTPVAAKLCPNLHVLMDENGEVSKKFGVSGIPQTVVIGRDGKVKKVVIGAGQEAKIRAAVEAALKD